MGEQECGPDERVGTRARGGILLREGLVQKRRGIGTELGEGGGNCVISVVVRASARASGKRSSGQVSQGSDVRFFWVVFSGATGSEGPGTRGLEVGQSDGRACAAV